MSTIKIKDLPEKTSDLDDEDLLIIEDTEDTKKITLLKLKSAFSMDGILTSMKNMLLDKINTFTENHSTRYKELEERTAQLEANCNNLENDHIHDANRIFELENNLVTQREQNNALQAYCTELLDRVNILQDQRDSLFDDSIKLNNQLVVATNLVNRLYNRVEELKNESNELKEKYNELQLLLNSMQETSTSVVDKNFTEINDEITSKINALMTYIRYYHPDVDDLEVN